MTTLGTFTRHDLATLADCVGDAWRAGAGGDWSAPAGTLAWSCARTADHAVDAPSSWPPGARTATRSGAGRFRAPGRVIWRRPRVEVRGPEDFPARGGLELVLHGHDVCAGLGVPLRPPPAEIARLIEHTRGWPHWQAPGWRPVASGGDPWAELLAAAGRQPAGTGMSPP
jgi:hypothetical protein